MLMYDFVDRPVAWLTPGGRFLLWAMRGWIHAASAGRCPPGALAPAFARHDVLPALPHLHLLLAELNQNAIRKIVFSPLPHDFIGEDEAVLLQLCRDTAEDPVRARGTLALLLGEEVLGAAFTALLAAIQRLGEGGLATVAFEEQRASGPR
jgi:hypothetical protein